MSYNDAEYIAGQLLYGLQDGENMTDLPLTVYII